jgi:hypothetical protein
LTVCPLDTFIKGIQANAAIGGEVRALDANNAKVTISNTTLQGMTVNYKINTFAASSTFAARSIP